VPVIAAVNGLAVGGGFELRSRATDRGGADAELFVPEVNLGFVPDAAASCGCRDACPRLALELLLTGRGWAPTRPFATGS
jgi:enoyl-CoA hydratase/carnithine racemase